MKKMILMSMALCFAYMPVCAETNALIEVKLFKDWVIKGECDFGGLAIKNTGTFPILLFKSPSDFEGGQLLVRPLPHDSYKGARQEEHYQAMREFGELISLLPGETHMYEERKIHLGDYRRTFSDEMRFMVSVYLSKGFWLDSETLTVKGVVPDVEEYLATLNNKKGNANELYKMVAVTCKNERWLYKKSAYGTYYSVCPLSPSSKVRVEDVDDEEQFKIWDGNKPMIFHLTKSILTEGPDENNVLGKWTRERKQKAEADNTEVRRKKAEAR